MPTLTPGPNRRSLGWNLAFSAYWFATSYKWFILLLIILPTLVEQVVPGGEKNTWWGRVLAFGALWAVIGPAVFAFINETGRGVWRGRWVWLVVGSGLTCVALGVLGSANSLWMLGIGFLLMQVSDDIGTGPYAGMVAEIVPKEHRGFSSAVLGALKLSGQIASALVGLAFQRIDLMMIGIGVVNVSCALATAWSVRNIPPKLEEALEEAEPPSFFKNYIAPFRDGDFRRVWANRFVVSIAFVSIMTFTRNYLKDAFDSYTLFGRNLAGSGDSPEMMPAIVLALTLSFSGIVGSVVSAKISDRIGRLPILRFSAVMVGLALGIAVFVRDYQTLWMLVSVVGAGYGAYAAADWALASDVLPSEDKPATQMGAWQSSETLVQVFVGGLMGWLIDAFNDPERDVWTGYHVFVGVAAVCFVLSIVFLKGIKRAR